MSNLTNRESDIIKLLLTGKKNKKIADELGISEATVETHLHNIYIKIQVCNRVEAVRKILQMKLISED